MKKKITELTEKELNLAIALKFFPKDVVTGKDGILYSTPNGLLVLHDYTGSWECAGDLIENAPITFKHDGRLYSAWIENRPDLPVITGKLPLMVIAQCYLAYRVGGEILEV